MTNQLPLLGRRILLPQREDSGLARAIAAAGARVDQVILINRVPVASAGLDTFVADAAAGRFDWLAITSAHTVDALAALGHPLVTLAGDRVAVAAVGPSTAAAVRAAGVDVDLIPAAGSGGAALVAAWPDGTGLVGIPGAAESAPGLRLGLAARGWRVIEVGVYRTSAVAAVPAELVDRWRRGGYDAFLVTSGSVARTAAALLGPTTPVVALGEPSASAARAAGFGAVEISASASATDVVAALATLVG